MTNMFEHLKKVDDEVEDTKFGKDIGTFLENSKSKVEKCQTEYDAVMKFWAEVCDFYMFPQSDEKRGKSDKFFEFFLGFFDDVQKSLPKPEKKSAKKKMQNAAMMAELQAKLAKK